MAQQLVSPLATGGDGVVYEYQVAAIMLSRLLRGAHVPVGIDLPISRVALQQRNGGFPLDDIVAYAGSDDDPVTIQIQVKRTLRLTRGNPHLVAVMAAAAEVCHTQPAEVADGSVLLGLAAKPRADDLTNLAELTRKARAHATPEGLHGLLREGVTDRRLRAMYACVEDAVAAATVSAGGDEVRVLTHQILAAMHVWPVLANSDTPEWRHELDGLSSLTTHSSRPPTDIMGHLVELAEEFGPRGGDFDAGLLRRRLLSRFGLRLSAPAPDSTRQAPLVSGTNTGPGTVIIGYNQTFHGSRFGN